MSSCIESFQATRELARYSVLRTARFLCRGMGRQAIRLRQAYGGQVHRMRCDPVREFVPHHRQ